MFCILFVLHNHRMPDLSGGCTPQLRNNSLCLLHGIPAGMKSYFTVNIFRSYRICRQNWYYCYVPCSVKYNLYICREVFFCRKHSYSMECVLIITMVFAVTLRWKIATKPSRFESNIMLINISCIWWIESIEVSNTYCVVLCFLFCLSSSCVLCTQCYQFRWIVHS